MAKKYRGQRVRDALHGLIEFEAEEFENVLWSALQTRPFQRLRRVKQLGFSELIYPGATHTRFAHCVGAFHVGRQLMKIIHRHKGRDVEESRVQQVLAATLVHDVGHGPFSHAFEEVGKIMGWQMADHEHVGGLLIRDSELSLELKKIGSGFASDVADIIKRGRPGNMYEAVVSSQFDADRLDYMQRDRLMTGTGHGAIDFPWLLANLEVGSVPQGVDETPLEPIETFVLGPKAVSAAETYVLGLFQLYETVYLHKATRGAEKLFTRLLLRIFSHIRDGNLELTGLSRTHPLVRFAQQPDDVELYLSLDDSTVWGSLSMLADSSDKIIEELATRLRDRRLYQCLEVRNLLDLTMAQRRDESESQELCLKIVGKLNAWLKENESEAHKLLIDRAERKPYKEFQETKGPLNQIRIRHPLDGKLVDLGSRSAVIGAIVPLDSWRLYLPKGDANIRKIVDDVVKEVANGNPSQA